MILRTDLILIPQSWLKKQTVPRPYQYLPTPTRLAMPLLCLTLGRSTPNSTPLSTPRTAHSISFPPRSTMDRHCPFCFYLSMLCLSCYVRTWRVLYRSTTKPHSRIIKKSSLSRKFCIRESLKPCLSSFYVWLVDTRSSSVRPRNLGRDCNAPFDSGFDASRGAKANLDLGSC